MDFTPLYLHSAPSSSLVSPNGAFVLSALEDRLVIRSSKTLEVIRSWKCGDKAIKANKSSARVLADSSNRASVAPPNPAPSERAVDSYLSCLSFSPLSSHVAALVRRPHPVAYVFALDAEEPVARLAVGAEGVAAGDRAVRWTPAGDALMIWSDWNLRMTIWPLTASISKPMQIALPKMPASAGYAFSPDGKYLAFVSRHPSTSRDHLGVYDAVSWRCLRHFPAGGVSSGATSDDLADVADVQWSPCGRYLAIVEASIFGLRVDFRTPTGVRIGRFPRAKGTPADWGRARSAGPRSQAVSSQPKGGETAAGLGTRTLAWRPQGDYIAVGGWDGKVRVVNDLSWTAGCEFDLNERKGPVSAFFEPGDWLERTRGRGIVAFDNASSTAMPSSVPADFGKPNPRCGVSELLWSPDGTILCCQNDGIPNALFVFTFDSTSEGDSSASFLRPRHTIAIIFNEAVRKTVWRPLSRTLWACCGTGAIYACSVPPPSADLAHVAPTIEGIGIPARVPFQAHSLSWTSDGSGVLVAGRTAFCLAFPGEERLEEESRVLDWETHEGQA